MITASFFQVLALSYLATNTQPEPPQEESQEMALEAGGEESEALAPDAAPEGGEASATENAATSSDEVAGKEPMPVMRTGRVISLGIGMHSCGQFFCKDTSKFNGGTIMVGPLLSMDFGLRPHDFFDVTAGFSFGYSPIKDARSGDFAQGWYGLQAIARFFPVRKSRFDPYVGMGMGFFQFWSWSQIGKTDRTYSFSRANMILTAGLDFFATTTFSVGPRVAYNLTFAGRYCYRYEDDDKECHPAKEFGDSSHVDSEEAGKKELIPRPWEFGLMVKWRR
jgi:hypothetical protein